MAQRTAGHYMPGIAADMVRLTIAQFELALGPLGGIEQRLCKTERS